MDRLKAMKVLLEVVKQGGFSAAARQLHISTSAVSRYVVDLEEWLGVQLLNRTTRRIHITEIGESYLTNFRKIVDDVKNLEQQSHALREIPQGELRITAPVFWGKYILSSFLPGFLKQFPKVKINIFLIDRIINLVEEGFDLALRIGELQDSSLIARKLGAFRLMVTASPSYLEQYGAPKSIEDLKLHNCLVDVLPQHGERWPFTRDKKNMTFRIQGNVVVNNGEFIRDLTLAGVGISLLPDFFVKKDVDSGRLVSFLEDNIQQEIRFSAVYPQVRHLSNNIRVFIDSLVGHISEMK
jgi:LysR family transcriptional regulator, regulator for bpeEF and oprC